MVLPRVLAHDFLQATTAVCRCNAAVEHAAHHDRIDLSLIANQHVPASCVDFATIVDALVSAIAMISLLSMR